MLGAILSFFGSGILKDVGEQLNTAYKAKLDAETNEKKIAAEELISTLQLQQAVLIEEQKRWLTAWIRPALAAPVVIFVWKILVWDSVLKLGFTPNPGELVTWIIMTIIGAYMVTRPFERLLKKGR